MRTRPASAAFVICLALALACAPAASAEEATSAPLDIEIAIDTTGSMGPSIEQAKKDAKEIVRDTRAQFPDVRFAVVQFRDKGDTPEYEVMQPMTTSEDAIAAAIAPLNADGGGDSPEAYNTVFQKSVTDASLGWRPEARKLVTVIGDAEPHGAGSAGLNGCSDETPDPFGLATLDVLGQMKAAERTLNLVLQLSSAQTTLDCYKSLARRGYGTGSAQASGTPGDGTGVGGGGGGGTGGSDSAAPLAGAIRESIGRSFPYAEGSGPARMRRGEKGRFRFRIQNPLPESVRLTHAEVTLPRGFRLSRASARSLGRPQRRGRRITWDTDFRLRGFAHRTLVLDVLASPRRGSFTFVETNKVFLPDRRPYSSRATKATHVG
jgi:hypothetical protein